MNDDELRAFLRSELAPIRAGVHDLRTGFDEVRTEFNELRTEFNELRTGFNEVRADLNEVRIELGIMRPNVEGIPVLQKAVNVLQTQMRAVRAAINDFALTNPTAGEIEALHEDVNKLQAENTELGTRLAGIERRLDVLERH
jgi:predicted nuclease with TOPRIM domain